MLRRVRRRVGVLLRRLESHRGDDHREPTGASRRDVMQRAGVSMHDRVHGRECGGVVLESIHAGADRRTRGSGDDEHAGEARGCSFVAALIALRACHHRMIGQVRHRNVSGRDFSLRY